NEYRVERDADIADLPLWIEERARASSAAPRKAQPGVELDSEIALADALSAIKADLAAFGPPVDGEGSDERTYKMAAKLKDYGISEETAGDLLSEHWAPNFEDDWIEGKVANAYAYGQNEPGADAVTWDAEEMAGYAAEIGAEAAKPAASLVDRFRGRRPSEYEAMPPLQFWDDEKTLPRSPAGAVAILYGEWGSHKTNTVLTMALEAILGRGARVCYAAGEGDYGVGKDRIPAHCRARGVAVTELDGKLFIVPAVPIFADPAQTAAFIEAQREFRPNIVVLDT